MYRFECLLRWSIVYQIYSFWYRIMDWICQILNSSSSSCISCFYSRDSFLEWQIQTDLWKDESLSSCCYTWQNIPISSSLLLFECVFICRFLRSYISFGREVMGRDCCKEVSRTMWTLFILFEYYWTSRYSFPFLFIE